MSVSPLNHQRPNILNLTSREIPESSVKDKIITPDTLGANIGIIPASKDVEIFPHGQIRGNVICLGDKPAGQEPGVLMYVRDQIYFDALKAITPSLEIFIEDQGLSKEAMLNLQTKYEQILETVYQQFIDKFNREKAYGFLDVKGKLYEPLFAQYSALMKECKQQGLSLKEAKASFKTYFLEQSLLLAQQSLLEVKKEMATSPDNALQKLEQAFDSNPVLMGIYSAEIEHRNQKVPKEQVVTTYMLKLDYQGKAVAYKGRLANTNTAKKAGLKAYYRFLKAQISKMQFKDKSAKALLLSQLKEAFEKKASVKSRQKKMEALILKTIESPMALLERAEAVQVKKQEKSIRLKHFAKKTKSYFASPLEVTLEAIKEKIGTQHASFSGLNSQAVQTIQGESLEDQNLPKQMLAAVWAKNFATFEDMAEGKMVLNGVHFPAIKLDGGEPPNPLSDSNYLSYQVQSPLGTEVAVSAAPLFKLGKHLALFLTHLDRDAIGKAGQNKGVTVDANGNVSLFAIDVGKSFQKKLKDFNLKDDFTFEQQGEEIAGVKIKGDITNIVNMASFYDSSYLERMEGVHLLAKQFGFSIPKEVKKDFASVWDNESIEKDSHLKPFNTEILYYEGLLKGNEKKIQRKQDEIKTLSFSKEEFSQEEKDKFKNEIMSLKATNQYYQEIIAEVNQMKGIMLANYETLLNTFSKRLMLTKTQLSILDGLEKLVSEPTRTSSNGQVLLHHLRIDPKKRIPFQFELDEKKQPKKNEKGQYTLRIETSNHKQAMEALASVKQYALEHPDLKELTFQEDPPAICFPFEQDQRLAKAFSEEQVAGFLGLNTPFIQQTLEHARQPQEPLKQPLAAHNTVPAGLTYAMPLTLKTAITQKRVKSTPILATIGIDPNQLRLKLNEKNKLVVIDKGIEIEVQSYIGTCLGRYLKTTSLKANLAEVTLMVDAAVDELNRFIKLSILDMPKKQQLLSHKVWLEKNYLNNLPGKTAYESLKNSYMAVIKDIKTTDKNKLVKAYKEQLVILYLSEKYIQGTIRKGLSGENKALSMSVNNYFKQEKKTLEMSIKKADFAYQDIMQFFKKYEGASFNKVKNKIRNDSSKKHFLGIANQIESHFHRKRKDNIDLFKKIASQKKAFLSSTANHEVDRIRSQALTLSEMLDKLSSLKAYRLSIGPAGQALIKEGFQTLKDEIKNLQNEIYKSQNLEQINALMNQYQDKKQVFMAALEKYKDLKPLNINPFAKKEERAIAENIVQDITEVKNLYNSEHKNRMVHHAIEALRRKGIKTIEVDELKNLFISIKDINGQIGVKGRQLLYDVMESNYLELMKLASKHQRNSNSTVQKQYGYMREKHNELTEIVKKYVNKSLLKSIGLSSSVKKASKTLTDHQRLDVLAKESHSKKGHPLVFKSLYGTLSSSALAQKNAQNLAASLSQTNASVVPASTSDKKTEKPLSLNEDLHSKRQPIDTPQVTRRQAYDFQFSHMNNSKAAVNQPLSLAHKELIKEVAGKSKHQYREEENGLFSVVGRNPLAVIGEAQIKGAPVISYTLTCHTAKEALHLLHQNEHLSQKDKLLKVEISNVVIDKKTYPIDTFKKDFEKEETFHNKMPPKGNSPH